MSKSDCDLHAYVIMRNYLHLLITPTDKTQLSRYMQTMANRYVRYFNATRNRMGTIWEGRFKSCLVESEKYLFTLYRYIEMNPVKAKMVKDIADYLWSSYQLNALGEEDSLIAEHELYLGLAESSALRAEHYQKIFESLSTSNQEQQITQATMKGEVYGTDGFYHKISQLISRVTKLTTHGGDRKSESYNDQAG